MNQIQTENMPKIEIEINLKSSKFDDLFLESVNAAGCLRSTTAGSATDTDALGNGTTFFDELRTELRQCIGVIESGHVHFAPSVCVSFSQFAKISLSCLRDGLP